jgi:trehalose 6-phosphate phosphatase
MPYMHPVRRRLLKRPPRLPPGGTLAIFVDLDGTLVDIADTPAQIAIDSALRELLARLRDACGGALALVSGRGIADLDAHLAPLQLPLAGQHGLERRDGAGRMHLMPGHERLQPVKQSLVEVLRRHPEILVEDKGLSLAVHYRRKPRLASWLHRMLRALIAATPGEFVLQRGKRVIELRLAGADKGAAIAAFCAEPPFRGRRPVFVGDDATDEHGFAMVNAARGISVKVGAGATVASHRLPDVASVLSWLATLLEDGK